MEILTRRAKKNSNIEKNAIIIKSAFMAIPPRSGARNMKDYLPDNPISPFYSLTSSNVNITHELYVIFIEALKYGYASILQNNKMILETTVQSYSAIEPDGEITGIRIMHNDLKIWDYCFKKYSDS